MKRILCILLLLLLTSCQKMGPASHATDLTDTAEASNLATQGSAAPTQPANRVEPVASMQPLNGALFDAPIIPLSWKKSTDAVRYRLQIAKDRDFTALQLDTYLTTPQKFTSPLPNGEYFWRVQAVSANDTASDFSPVHSFTIRQPQNSFEIIEEMLLDIRHLYQHKDSAMLLLESPIESGTHAWNRAHSGYDANDPACYANSSLACIAMMNHFYGGNLTQDRLGYEIFKDTQPGPEFDLPYGTAPTEEEITQLITFALGGEQSCYLETSSDQAETAGITPWIIHQIKQNSPILASIDEHYVVLAGYQYNTQEELLWVLDPAAGTYRVKSSLDWGSACVVLNAQARQLEESLLSDSDQDGVLDFDETERFRTDPFRADSDRDGISDGDEIRASVLDARFGYAFSQNTLARDADMDGLPPELDIDSDGGGCLDGFEDANLNGFYEPGMGETSVFDPQDDRCYNLKSTWQVDDDWGRSTAEWSGSFKIDSLNDIVGCGVMELHHTGNCIQSRLVAAFYIEGKYQDDLHIRIRFENEYETGVYSPEEISEGCTIGQAVEENWAISYGLYNGIPDVFLVPLPKPTEFTEMTTTSPEGASRNADIHLIIQRIRE